MPLLGLWLPIGPSTVLVLVLGKELVWGDCVSSVSKGGVGAAEVSNCEGGEESARIWGKGVEAL